LEARTRTSDGIFERGREISGGLVDHRVEEDRFGLVVIENRLFADAQLGSELVERGRLVPASAE
jgi:hypothetical protein